MRVHDRNHVLLRLRIRMKSMHVRASIGHLARVIADVLLCPGSYGRAHGIDVFLIGRPSGRVVTYQVRGDPVTSSEFTSRGMSIRRGVGRLFFRRFGNACRARGIRRKRVTIVAFACPALSWGLGVNLDSDWDR